MATFPTKESLLNNYFIVAVAYILANIARLGVSLTNKATMISCLATWNNIYPLASTAATSTTSNVADKKHCEKGNESDSAADFWGGNRFYITLWWYK